MAGTWVAPWAGLYPNQHQAGCFWHEAARVWGSPNVQWCEENLCQVVSQPANTWSNLAFFVAAAVAWVYPAAVAVKLAKHTKHNTAAERTAPKTPLGTFPAAMLPLYPLTLVVMGALSLVYHLSNIYPTQNLDFVGMFGTLAWIFAANWIRSGGPQLGGALGRAWLPSTAADSRRFLLLTFVVAAVVTHVTYVLHLKIQGLVVVGIAACVYTEIAWCKPIERALPPSQTTRFTGHFFWLGLFFIGLAAVFSWLDHTRRFCDPTNHVVQGHALWHLLSAFGLWLVYRHFGQRVSQ